MKAARAHVGLTLIEVLIAITILSVGLIGLVSGAVRAVAVVKVTREYQEAQWTLSRGDLEFPIEMAEEPEDIEVSGETYDNGMRYSREIDEDEDEDGLRVVRTRVTWNRGDREAMEVVERYVYFEPEEEK
jgi:prepilin-type N-terminal cleavage/methylation domain-containing protein